MLSKRTAYILVPALVLLAWLLTPPEQPSPEELIRQALDEMVQAAHDKDLAALMDWISDDFQGQAGDRRALKAYLFLQFQRGAWRRVFLVDTEIEVDAGTEPPTAVVNTQTALATGENVTTLEDALDASAGLYSIEITFRRESDGVWRVSSGQHERATAADFLP